MIGGIEIKENNNGGLIVIIAILSLVVIALGGFIGYDKFLKDNSSNMNDSNIKEEVEDPKEENDCQSSIDKSKYIEKRTCNGIYQGRASLTQDFKTGEYTKGLLTIELKEDGTYNMKKENINSISGSYIIINNTLLLGEKPEVCKNGNDCSILYTQYLSISEDCTTISDGYGSYFFDSNFELRK